MNRILEPSYALVPAALALLLAGCSSSSTSPNQPLPPHAVDSLAVSPTSATVAAGNTQHFTATAYDSAGALVSGAALLWTSRNPAVFTVDDLGRATGEAPGTAFLIVSSGSATDSASVTVTPATPGWIPQTSGVTGTSLNAITFFAGGIDGWAVGDAGRIVHTGDGGSTWDPELSGTSVPLNGVWFTSRTNGWAVGGSGNVLATQDGGESWQRVFNVNTSSKLNAVCFAGADSGWIVGAGGLILRTTNSGASWSRVNPTTSALNGVSFAGPLDGWAVGDNGIILGTHDGGKIWFTVLPAQTASTLRSIWRVSEPRANAVGAAGVTPRTNAAPDTTRWELDNAGASYDLDGVFFPNANLGFAVGSNGNGVVLRSDDGGVIWEPQIAGTGNRLHAVFFASPQRGWAVGDNGTILHAVTGGLP